MKIKNQKEDPKKEPLKVSKKKKGGVFKRVNHFQRFVVVKRDNNDTGYGSPQKRGRKRGDPERGVDQREKDRRFFFRWRRGVFFHGE